MSRGRITWIVAPLLLSLAGCGESKYPDFLKPLANATEITLYSIDGVDESTVHPVPKTDEKFYSYPVLGKLTVDAETRDAIVRELDRSTRNAAQGKRCFWPRHALRAANGDKVIDYVICFECHSIWVFDGDKWIAFGTDSEPQELLNRLLAAKEIPVVP
jgi:hypothetical protein